MADPVIEKVARWIAERECPDQNSFPCVGDNPEDPTLSGCDCWDVAKAFGYAVAQARAEEREAICKTLIRIARDDLLGSPSEALKVAIDAIRARNE